MSQRIEEQLSTLLDGELPVEEEELLLQRLARDPELRATLSRYSLVGECIRGGGGAVDAMGLSDRVRDALGAEEQHKLLPAHVSAGLGRKGSMLGFGLAAGLAFIAVFNLGGFYNEVLPVQSLPFAGAGLNEDAGDKQVLRQFTSGYRNPVSGRASARVVIAPDRMMSYLVSHGEYSNAWSRPALDSHIVNRMARTAVWQVSGDFVDE